MLNAGSSINSNEVSCELLPSIHNTVRTVYAHIGMYNFRYPYAYDRFMRSLPIGLILNYTESVLLLRIQLIAL